MKGKRGPVPGPRKRKQDQPEQDSETMTNGGAEHAAPEQEEASAGVGHNSEPRAALTEDQTLALLFQHKKAYEKALAAKKLADAALKNVAKLAKSELGPTAMADIKDMILMDSPEGEASLRAEVERRAKIARWMGLPVGTQGSIFEQNDPRPAVETAFAEGKRYGLDGQTCSPPHDPSVPQYQAWIDGWHEGQAVLASDFRTLVRDDEDDELDALDPIEGAEERAEMATQH